MVVSRFSGFDEKARMIVNATLAQAMAPAFLMDHARNTIRLLESGAILKHLSLKCLNPEWRGIFTELFAATIGLVNAIETHENQPR